MNKRMISENSQWTAADFDRARPAREVLPKLFDENTAAQMLKPFRSPKPAPSGDA